MAKSNGIQKYPRNEHVWVGYYKGDDLMFILTSKQNDRTWFFLYQLVDGEFKKLGKAHTPPELEEKYGVNQAIKQ